MENYSRRKNYKSLQAPKNISSDGTVDEIWQNQTKEIARAQQDPKVHEHHILGNSLFVCV